VFKDWKRSRDELNIHAVLGRTARSSCNDRILRYPFAQLCSWKDTIGLKRDRGLIKRITVECQGARPGIKKMSRETQTVKVEVPQRGHGSMFLLGRLEIIRVS
jgi:hypothetical protein